MEPLVHSPSTVTPGSAPRRRPPVARSARLVQLRHAAAVDRPERRRDDAPGLECAALAGSRVTASTTAPAPRACAAAAAAAIGEPSTSSTASAAKATPTTCSTPSPGPDDVAVEGPVALRMERREARRRSASSRWLNRPSGSVSYSRLWTRARRRDHALPPAPPAPAFGHGPGHERAVGPSAAPGQAHERVGHDGVAASVPSASTQRPATASSSPATAGATRPRTCTSRSPYSISTVPRSRTRASSSPAAYGR